MKIAYIGTPSFSARLLERIISHQHDLGIEIAMVITQPDMPVGRKQVLTSTPVKEIALQNNLPISYDLGVLEKEKVDLALLFAFGKIVPGSVLALPIHGFWNVHPSLLPLFRGASPMVFPLLLGESETGVSLMQMDADMDHGPIIDQKSYSIKPEDTRGILETILTEMGYELFAKKIQILSRGAAISLAEQDHDLATYTRPLTKQDGYIEVELLKKALSGATISSQELPALIKNWFQMNTKMRPAPSYNASQVVWNMCRALHGWPGVWTIMLMEGQQKRLKIIDATFREGTFHIETVQMEGKRAVPFTTFSKVYAF